MGRKWVLLWVLAGVFLVGVLKEKRSMGIEIPSYQVLSSDKNVEIRQYQPHLVAAVLMEGERRDSLYRGFRVLADYIFGNNRARAKMAMTAPVGVEAPSEKVAMTAPVGVAPSGNLWKVTFVMPSKYTMETLPLPNDSRVLIEQVPGKKMAAWGFSGWATEGNVEKNRRLFVEQLKAQSVEVRGDMQLAQYDPPWSIPFFRRNEWLVEVL